MPKLSIIVPVYNVETVLEKCILSITKQTEPDIEIILVDDGSLDKSGIICDKFALNDSRIKVIHKENQGLGFARNSGLELATGEYVGFVDSDDFVSNEMFGRLYCNAKKYDADVSYCAYIRFSDESKISKAAPAYTNCYVYNSEKIRQYILDRIGKKPESIEDNLYGACVWGGIFRNNIIKKYNLKFVSERQFIAEDIIFDIDFLSHCNTVVHCNDKMYFYRYNPNSLTILYKENRFDKNVVLYYEMCKKLKKIYNEKEYFNSMSRYFLTFTRVCIIQEAMYLKYNGHSHAIKKIKEICENKELIKILKTYEYRKQPFKYKLFCCLEAKKFYYLLLYLSRINLFLKR